jgi:hypothetical protein
MNILNFLCGSLYDWFYRNGKPRNPKSLDKPQDRVIYVMTVGALLWIIGINFTFSYLNYGIFHNSKYLDLGLAAIIYLLLYLFYLKNKRLESVYEEYKILYGPNNIKNQIVAIILVFILPITITSLLTLHWHNLI